jgi:hypothetical protein
VAYYDAFWAVAGGSAPVIALAAVVVLGQALDQSIAMTAAIVATFDQADPEKINFQKLDELRPRQPKIQRRTLWMIFVPQVVNLVIQCAVLAFSLLSLADHLNFIRPRIVTIGVVVGIALLAECTVAMSLTKDAAGDIVKAYREALHPQPGSDVPGPSQAPDPLGGPEV